jgi:hypothetical protein
VPDDDPEEDRVRGRAELLPEELAAGSDDPTEQADALLKDSDERTEQAIAEREHDP